jgi:hypothetical protein
LSGRRLSRHDVDSELDMVREVLERLTASGRGAVWYIQ